ncbi:MAG TPA: substrate-binding domain-containing protein [Solirubrobacterales bacterium]|nr:substrate-binding domain-containing protein [Solirubrobacterales bacterium]
MIRAAVAIAVLTLLAGCGSDGEGSGAEAAGAEGALILATTTSTRDSGLLDAILPRFEAAGDCAVKPVAVGSGEAIEIARRGDADVLLAHSPAEERAFMREGHGADRRLVMRNDFVLVGPTGDPADVAAAPDVTAALRRIVAAGAPFASRGDDSGTHAKELDLWRLAGLEPDWPDYLETGQGMGPTLQIAAQKRAYTLTDRGTFLATEGLDSRIVHEGDRGLANRYHVIEVRDAANAACAAEFADWITQAATQRAIGSFGADRFEEPLFVPASKDGRG